MGKSELDYEASFESLCLFILFLFTLDSVFEDEGVETPPTAAQPAEKGDKAMSSPNSAESEATEGEEGEHQPAQMNSGTGQHLLFFISSL